MIGILIVIGSLTVLFFAPDSLSRLFDTIVKEIKPVVVDTFLTSEVGIAVIASVIVGRVLERFGFTDGLIRLFVPIMKWFKINPAVIIPSAYNILGDINAAGKIAGPILVKAKATKAEQKIAVATMIQSPQSFATFVLGLIALSIFGIDSFLLILLSIFAPLIIVPFVLSNTIYRDTKKVTLEELPRFTPKTTMLNTFFSSAKEGTELLFLVIIPAVSVVFLFIGILKFAGIWDTIETSMAALLTMVSIEPDTGIVSFLVAPTLAVAQLADLAATIDPRLIVGSFVLANSGLPIYVIIGQIPAIWAETSDLCEREVIYASLIGILIRVATACILGYFLTPYLVV
ncbi:hypothetical protein CFK37_09065 [Virgibacillus phasianinus]|uniref:Nucleoside transporter/FeoB GTPase Gate domain-containing protein n=1 Tax=Virgibacillus phasianinus TaxID=2017483 RepID=A0A220U7T3_9BACI|nr:hypothetical protein CFK37_09065 [Virgibacillus phasianinus]